MSKNIAMTLNTPFKRLGTLANDNLRRKEIIHEGRIKGASRDSHQRSHNFPSYFSEKDWL